MKKWSSNPEGPVVIVSKDIVYAFPFGIAYLAGALRKSGEDVRVLFRPEHPKHFLEFARLLISLKPLVVGFGSLYPDLYPVREIIRTLDGEGRNFPVVIGGQMVSPTPEFSVQITGADIGLIGEGEIIFRDLVRVLRRGDDLGAVRGLAIRDGERIYLTGPGPFIEDLSDLPPVPYDLFPSKKWLEIGRFYARNTQPHWRFEDRVVSLHGGRGCPFSCNFCYHSSKSRYRKIPEILCEAEELIPRFDANMLYFGDDLVLGTPKRAQELTEGIGNLGRSVEYSVSCRFDILSRISDSLLRDMKKTGCRIMGLGIESGSQRILDAMHKKVEVEQIREGLSRLKKAGILPTVSIMVGQVSETREDVGKSLQLMVDAVRENKLIQFAFTITTPYPGSELYEIAFRRGLLKDHMDFFRRHDPERQILELSVNFSEMSDEEVRESRKTLENTFRKEIWKSRGLLVGSVDFTRKALGLLDSLIRTHGSPAVTGEGRTANAYNRVYDGVQMRLDRTRLNALGID